MRHQNRDFGIRQNRCRGATKDHLPQTALGITALDDKIGTQLVGLFQNDLARCCRRATSGDDFQQVMMLELR